MKLRGWEHQFFVSYVLGSQAEHLSSIVHESFASQSNSFISDREQLGTGVLPKRKGVLPKRKGVLPKEKLFCQKERARNEKTHAKRGRV